MYQFPAIVESRDSWKARARLSNSARIRACWCREASYSRLLMKGSVSWERSFLRSACTESWLWKHVALLLFREVSSYEIPFPRLAIEFLVLHEVTSCSVHMRKSLNSFFQLEFCCLRAVIPVNILVFSLFVSVPQQVSLYLLWSVTWWGQSSDARIVNFTKTGSSGPFWCGVRKCVVRIGELQDALGLLTCERTLDGQVCDGCDSMGSPRKPRRRSGSAGCCGKCDASGGSTCGDVARAVDLFCKDAKFDKWCSKITLSRTREKCCVCECDCGRCTVYNNNYNLKQLEQSKQPRANWKNRAQNEASWKTNNNKKHRQTKHNQKQLPKNVVPF